MTRLEGLTISRLPNNIECENAKFQSQPYKQIPSSSIK